MKMFEYMAAGRLVLSSDLPVLREVLHDGNAALIDPEDPAAWIAAVCRARDEPAWRDRLAAAARADVAQYAWPRRVERILGALEI